MIKQLIAGAVIALTATVAGARPYDDVSVYIYPESYSYKVKKGTSLQINFSTLLTYYSDASEPSKAKATGRVWFYISNDSSPSLDDKFVQSKKISLKDQKDKVLKSKLTIDVSDTGKYLIAVVDSPQDITGGPSYWAFPIPLVLIII